LSDLDIQYRKIYNTRHTFITAILKSEKLSALEIAQIVGHTNPKMIIENYARYIKGVVLMDIRFAKMFVLIVCICAVVYVCDWLREADLNHRPSGYESE